MVLGTGSPEYLRWAAGHAGDEEFSRLYAGRIATMVESCLFLEAETGEDYGAELARLKGLAV